MCPAGDGVNLLLHVGEGRPDEVSGSSGNRRPAGYEGSSGLDDLDRTGLARCQDAGCCISPAMAMACCGWPREGNDRDYPAPLGGTGPPGGLMAGIVRNS